jgi:hypothetical protein
MLTPGGYAKSGQSPNWCQRYPDGPDSRLTAFRPTGSSFSRVCRPTWRLPAAAVLALSFFKNLVPLDAQRLGHAFAVGRIGLHAVADVANLDLLRGIAHRAGGVLEQRLLLFGRH